MDILNTLIKQGFSENQAAIYIALLKHNGASPGEVSQETGIKRPTCYLELQKLEQKGFTESKKTDKKIMYMPVSPEYLLEKCQKNVENLEKSLQKMQELNQKSFQIPHASIYQGIQGIIHVMEHTLGASTDILGWANVELIYSNKEIFENHAVSYHRRRIEKKIWIRSLYKDDKWGRKLQQEGEKTYRETFLLPEEIFPFPGELKIFDDKIITISTKDMVGTIIQNQHIADTYRSLFWHQFEYAKNLASKKPSHEY